MNLLALPFYESLSKQLRNSACRSYATALLAPTTRFLPFVVKRFATGQGLDCVNIYSAESDQRVAVVQPSQIDYEVYTDGVYDYYTYFGGNVRGMNLICGEYYLELKGQYSEVFKVVENISRFLKVEFTNAANIAGIPYAKGFLQRLYLDTALAEPVYKHEEEGEEDGDKVFVALEHRLAKTFKFESLLLPQFLVDVLNALPIHSQVTIGTSEVVTDIEVEVGTWTKDTCAGSLTVNFQEPPVLAKACGAEVEMTLVDVSGYVPNPALCDGQVDDSPIWQPTGGTRCLQDAQGHNNGYKEREESDVNPNSPTFQDTRWLPSGLDPVACPAYQVFRSAAISENVYRDDCGAEGESTAALYTVAEGQVVDETSQADVDARARQYFDANKQAFARANATCQQKETALNCQWSPAGCWTGFMVDQYGNTYEPGLLQCQQCNAAQPTQGSDGNFCVTYSC